MYCAGTNVFTTAFPALWGEKRRSDGLGIGGVHQALLLWITIFVMSTEAKENEVNQSEVETSPGIGLSRKFLRFLRSTPTEKHCRGCGRNDRDELRCGAFLGLIQIQHDSLRRIKVGDSTVVIANL